MLGSGPGASWDARHGVLGISCFGAESVLDGINDAGLSAGAFYFPGWAEYAAEPVPSGRVALAPTDFVHWALTSFATTAELRAAVADVSVVGVDLPDWGGVPPFHYVAYDRDGTAVAIEPRGGALEVTDLPLGSFTNSPEIGFHLTNLAQHLEVSPDSTVGEQLGPVSINAFGAGAGGLGLPGDFTPPSRFVRATFYSVDHEPPVDGPTGVHEVFHLLNQFDIPRGFVVVHEGRRPAAEWTLATVVRDPAAGDYHVRTYGDQSIRKANLADVLSRATGPVRAPAGPSIGAATPVTDVGPTLTAAAPADAAG